MKLVLKLSTFALAFVMMQSCGGEAQDESGNSNGDGREQEMNDADSDQNMQQAKSNDDNKTEEKADYHITLNKGGEEMATGMSKGKAMISDNWICTVGDWKMRILVDEFNPEGMVGKEYNAHVISQDFNSNDCQCQMENITGTGIKNSTGERVKMEGSISCDGGETTGTFAVQLIQPGK
ncbi:MAG: hypothetical protein Crog4KO_01620 [Crocinitomicaceae bacterium]